jgi:hypothetical protein
MNLKLGPLGFLAILILLLGSCTRPPGDITVLSLTPDNASPKQGQTIKVKVEIDRINSYDKTLAVQIDPLPAGVTADPATIGGNVNSTEVSVKLNNPGPVNLNFKVSGQDITTKEKLLDLTVLPTENFELTLDKTSLAQNPGSEGKVKVTVQRNATMNQPITVSISAASLPTGVTVDPIIIPANASTGDLTFKVAANAPAISNKDLTISATGQGITKTAPFKITVNLLPDFSLAFDPVGFNSLTIGQGASGQVKVKATRNATHTEAIAVSLEGLPAKVTSDPITIAAGQTDGTLTINVAADAVPANAVPITVKAVGQAVTKNLNFALSISNVVPEILSISVSPATKTISQGGTDKVTVSVQRNATLSGAISIAASNLPNGVSAPNVTIPAGSSSVDLNLSASQTAQLVTDQTITVTASATGAANKTATFKLTTQVGPGFSLALSSGSATILKGTSGNTTINLTRDAGFTADVVLSIEGLPSGVTPTFNPASLTGTTLSSTLTLAVASTVTAGDYALKVKGTAGVAPSAKVVEQTLNLKVPDLAATAANLSIVRADSAILTVNITRSAFSGPVNVVLSGLPAGVTTTAPASTITIAANATSGTFTLNAAEDMPLDPLSPTPPGNPTSADKLLKELTLTATATGAAPLNTLSKVAKPMLTVKPQFELKLFKGQQAGTGVCLNNPIDSVTLQQGAVGIQNPTSPESDWICITLVRNGSFANRPAGQNHVFLSYQAAPDIAESGQSESGYGFYPSEIVTGSTKGNFFLKAKPGAAAATYLYYVRAYEVVTPDTGSGPVLKDGQGGRKLVVTDTFLKLIVTP